MRAHLLLTPLWLVVSAPATAQGIAVHDNASLLKLIEQVKTAGDQLRTLERTYSQLVETYNNVHGLTNASDIASDLNSEGSRRWLPTGSRDIEQLMKGPAASLGPIGQAAANIRSGRRVSIPDLPPAATDAERTARAQLSTEGDRSATHAAVADAAFNATTSRTGGLEQLRQALNTAATQKEVQDLQARIAIEQAHIQNDAMQLQAIKMRQEAEDRLIGQQAMEKVAAQRAVDAAKWTNR